jgi:hypothetical protein
MELSPSSEAASYAAAREFHSIYETPKFHYNVRKTASTGPSPEPDRSSPCHPILFI